MDDAAIRDQHAKLVVLTVKHLGECRDAACALLISINQQMRELNATVMAMNTDSAWLQRQYPQGSIEEDGKQ